MQMKALALVTIAALALATGVERAVAESGDEAQEQTVPQSEAGTSAGDITPLPPTEHEGVIEPPDVGDEGIHTDVPNPDAGHPEEVIPPSELPEQTPETNPR
jgi:hypothetical protein